MRTLSEAKFKDTPRHTFCGPYAVSAITGKPVEDIEDTLNRRRGKMSGTKIVTTYNTELRLTMCSLGFRATLIYNNMGPSRKSPTLAKWLRERCGPETTATYLVLVTGHWIAVKGRKMVDTWTKKPIFIGKAPHRRKRVQVVIVVDK